jgi:hypothetical protein
VRAGSQEEIPELRNGKAMHSRKIFCVWFPQRKRHIKCSNKRAFRCGAGVTPAFLYRETIEKVAGETPAPRKACALI